MLCLVLFTTAHADQHALCVTLLDLLTLFYFKFFISPNSQYFILSTVHTLSAPHKPHFRPRRGFCLLYTQLISGACRESCVEERLKVLRALHCQREPALLPGASPLGLDAPSAFPFTALVWRKCTRGTDSPWGGFDRREKVKTPPGSTPAVHFTVCMSRDGRGEVSEAVQVADVTTSRSPQSLLWCLVSRGSTAVLLWCRKARYCLLFRQQWGGLTALWSFSVHTFISLM